MPKSLRCLTIALTDIPDEYKITLGYLTYHSGKLFNQALHLVKTKQAKINIYDLYKKLKDSSLHLKIFNPAPPKSFWTNLLGLLKTPLTETLNFQSLVRFSNGG